MVTSLWNTFVGRLLYSSSEYQAASLPLGHAMSHQSKAVSVRGVVAPVHLSAPTSIQQITFVIKLITFYDDNLFIEAGKNEK
jgi:hypothetical protein